MNGGTSVTAPPHPPTSRRATAVGAVSVPLAIVVALGGVAALLSQPSAGAPGRHPMEAVVVVLVSVAALVAGVLLLRGTVMSEQTATIVFGVSAGAVATMAVLSPSTRFGYLVLALLLAVPAALLSVRDASDDPRALAEMVQGLASGGDGSQPGRTGTRAAATTATAGVLCGYGIVLLAAGIVGALAAIIALIAGMSATAQLDNDHGGMAFAGAAAAGIIFAGALAAAVGWALFVLGRRLLRRLPGARSTAVVVCGVIAAFALVAGLLYANVPVVAWAVPFVVFAIPTVLGSLPATKQDVERAAVERLGSLAPGPPPRSVNR